MQRRKMICIGAVLSLIICPGAVFAGEPMHFELSDGSVIQGEILSFENGVYTIRSEVVGTIRIKESGVRTIRRSSTAKNSGSKTEKTDGQINQQAETLIPQMATVGVEATNISDM